MYVNRTYRDLINGGDLKTFRVSVKETDLHISVDPASCNSLLERRVEKLVLALRYDLEEYIAVDPDFKTTLNPHPLVPGAPPIAQTMARAANRAGVGPMAAVAGAFAEYVGRDLSTVCSQVIVENGGDIFLSSTGVRRAAIFAGSSPFSHRLAIELTSDRMPLGVCTSSGTVGPSLSLGRADAAVIVAYSAALADAVASAAGNVVQNPGDVKKGVEVAKSIPGVLGAVIIKEDQLSAWGEFKLVPIMPGKSATDK